MHNNHYI